MNLQFQNDRQNLYVKRYAQIIAKQDGIIVGTAMVDHLIQIWAPSIQISWKALDGK